MKIGYPPFLSENPAETCSKITNWKTNFKIPDSPPISKEAKDILRRLICDAGKT
jgi:hypothetical protein